MDDSFSLLAKSIRQQKINKDELLNNLKEITDAQNRKDKYIKNIIKIQKVVRGHLYRIQYRLTLDEINTKTIIDYLYEKKKKRIHNHSKEIISFFIMKYINKMRKTKKKNMLLEQYKIHCSDLIKARFRGILVRKHVKEQLNLVKNAKDKIFKHILSYRTVLILKSNTIQNLLVDIAKIKNQIKSMNKNKDNNKIKELKNKLSKNINLFYDTYYYTKENCNWVIEKKTSGKWNKKYFEIINKKTEKVNNAKKEIKSGDNGYTNYLLDFYNDSDGDEGNYNAHEQHINQNYLTNLQKSNYSSTINSTQKKEFYQNKRYGTSKNVSEFKIDDIKNKKEPNKNKNKEKIGGNVDNKNNDNNNDNFTDRKKSKFISDKELRYSYIKEENKKLRKEINNIDLNNINNNIFNKNKNKNNKNKDIQKEKEEFLFQSSSNIYQQREERPIKPLKINNILNCENPFGLRDNNFKKTNTVKEEKIPYNPYHKRNTMKPTIPFKEKEENKPFNEEEYAHKKTNSGKKNNYVNNKFLNRDEKPVGGGKIIDYEAMFGEDGEINFDGDPFGGVKQFETNKNKIHNKANSTITRKKPVYDARKAIEEAKLKEGKEGKKEKHTEFREFLKEMKKISAEEKNKKKNNNNNSNNGKKVNDSLDIKKSFSESLNKNGNEIINGNGIYKDNYTVDENNNNNKGAKRENSINKASKSNKMLRKKLHDLEKAPAPILNIKGAKSKIECWFDNNTNNNGNKYMEYSAKPNGQHKIKKRISKDNNEMNNNIIINKKKIDKDIENYVDKKLSQLNLQIDKINDIFSIESYFEQKKNKMKKFVNIPYINEDNEYVQNYSDNIYNDLIEDIYKEYKNLK